MKFLKITNLLIFIICICFLKNCQLQEASWNELLKKTASNALMSISYKQKTTSYSKYPSIQGELPAHLAMQTVPLIREENFQFSILKKGDVEIFCEFIPTDQPGIKSAQLPSTDIPEEPRYFHYKNGFASYYDAARNLFI